MRFLQNTSFKELASFLEPHMHLPAWPGLQDPSAQDRARAYLRQNGRWDQLPREANPHLPFPRLTHSLYRDYRHTGNRTAFENEYRRLQRELNSSLLAHWLDHPETDLPRTQDLIWAICEMSTWVLPAHEPLNMDLSATALGRTLAEAIVILEGRLDEEIRQRIEVELQHRLLVPATNPAKADLWQTCDTNWNHVCNGNLIGVGLYQIKDPLHLAAFLHPIIIRLGYAVDGFTDDGGCVEGPGYWDYGFTHFVDAALMIHCRTGGQINLMTEDPKIERISRFPLATYLSGPRRATFSDSPDGWISASAALRINQFFPIPELFTIAEKTRDEASLFLNCLRDFALFQGEHPSENVSKRDCFLPDLGFAKAHASDLSHDVILAVIGGSNGVPHNHNDLGSFMLCHEGDILLTDPGAPIYNAQTFGPNRYDNFVCRSRGHSVPLINSHEQSAGTEFIAPMTVENFGDTKEGQNKSIFVDLTKAYADPTLSSLSRRWDILPGGKIKMTDTFSFSKEPTAIEEAFLTYVSATISNDFKSVRLVGENSSIILRCECDGAFDLETLSQEAHGGRSNELLHRVRFTPNLLSLQMVLTFVME